MESSTKINLMSRSNHEIIYEVISGYSERMAGLTYDLGRQIFGDEGWSRDKINTHLLEEKDVLAIFAFSGNEAIAYKVGYREDEETFYSWVGGVLPAFRREGIALRMMELQHNWCREHGFVKVSTKTQNRFKNMLILNLTEGFEIVGTGAGKDGQLDIILHKAVQG